MTVAWKPEPSHLCHLKSADTGPDISLYRPKGKGNYSPCPPQYHDGPNQEKFNSCRDIILLTLKKYFLTGFLQNNVSSGGDQWL